MASIFHATSTATTSEGLVNLPHTPTSAPDVLRIEREEAEAAARLWFRQHAMSLCICDSCNVCYPSWDRQQEERDAKSTQCFNCGHPGGYRLVRRGEAVFPETKINNEVA